MILNDHEVARNQGCRCRAAFALFFAVFIFTMSWAVSEEAEKMDITMIVDPANKARVNDGVFEGWGTSLCWWANRIGYSDALSQKAATVFCDPAQGLGMNILRYNIGGGR